MSYDVERILEERWVEGEAAYLVKWLGYPDEECTWEPSENFDDPATLKQWEIQKAEGDVPTQDELRTVQAKMDAKAQRDGANHDDDDDDDDDDKDEDEEPGDDDYEQGPPQEGAQDDAPKNTIPIKAQSISRSSTSISTVSDAPRIHSPPATKPQRRSSPPSTASSANIPSSAAQTQSLNRNFQSKRPPVRKSNVMSRKDPVAGGPAGLPVFYAPTQDAPSRKSRAKSNNDESMFSGRRIRNISHLNNARKRRGQEPPPAFRPDASITLKSTAEFNKTTFEDFATASALAPKDASSMFVHDSDTDDDTESQQGPAASHKLPTKPRSPDKNFSTLRRPSLDASTSTSLQLHETTPQKRNNPAVAPRIPALDVVTMPLTHVLPAKPQDLGNAAIAPRQPSLDVSSSMTAATSREVPATPDQEGVVDSRLGSISTQDDFHSALSRRQSPQKSPTLGHETNNERASPSAAVSFHLPHGGRRKPESTFTMSVDEILQKYRNMELDKYIDKSKVSVYIAFARDYLAAKDIVEEWLLTSSAMRRECIFYGTSGWKSFKTKLNTEFCLVLLADNNPGLNLHNFGKYLSHHNLVCWAFDSDELQDCQTFTPFEIFRRGTVIAITAASLLENAAACTYLVEWLLQKKSAADEGTYRIMLPPRILDLLPAWVERGAPGSQTDALVGFWVLIRKLIMDLDDSDSMSNYDSDGTHGVEIDKDVLMIPDEEVVFGDDATNQFSWALAGAEGNEVLMLEYFSCWAIRFVTKHRRFMAFTTLKQDVGQTAPVIPRAFAKLEQEYCHVNFQHPVKFMRKEQSLKQQ